MKKKLLIFSLATLSLFTFTGCTNNQTKAITTLENQTKRIDSVISNSSSDDISSVSPSVSSENIGYSIIQSHKANSYNNMTRENQLKQDVLSLNSSLKTCLNDNLKLSKSKVSAIKTLASNISENLSKYNETKSQVKKNVKNIKQSLKVPNINVVGAESEYISLNGNMNQRYVYLCNIYDNLEQAYFIICDCCPNNSTSEQTQNNTNQYNQTEITKEKQNKNSRFKKNIDSYAPSTKETEKQVEKSNSNEKNTKDIRNIDTFNNFKPPIYNQNNTYNAPYNYGYNNMPMYGYYNGYNNPYGYNNGYAYSGYANGFRRFNPNRNTDTFYPYNRNIDTYRTAPNLNFPVSGTPINTDNDKIEEIKENGVINIKDANDDFIVELPNEQSNKDDKIVNIIDKEVSTEASNIDGIVKKSKDLLEKTKQGD